MSCQLCYDINPPPSLSLSIHRNLLCIVFKNTTSVQQQGGARNVTITDARNGHGDPSSYPEWDC